MIPISTAVQDHGTDSGCGDNNWPKAFGFLAGWGFGHATLNGKPLYQDYEVHFMVTQGIRDRKTLKVDSYIPLTMAVIYLLILIYFKGIGGYKAVHVDEQKA